MSEVTEVVEPALDAASEAILEGVDGVADVVTVVKNNPTLVVVAAFGGVALGFGLGYFIAVKRLGKQFDQRLEQEVEATREFFRSVNKVDDDGAVLTPREVMEQRHGRAAAEEAIAQYRGEQAVEDILDDEEQELLAKSIEKIERDSTEVEEAPDEDEGPFNVFADDHFDLEVEKKSRKKSEPYVLSRNEYFANEPEHDQVAWTYYAGDDILVDENDAPVRDYDYIGEDNVRRFGHGSGDRNTVYIRNEKLELDYEVVRSDGYYVRDVLDLPTEDDDDKNSLRHSSHVNRKRAFQRGFD